MKQRKFILIIIVLIIISLSACSFSDSSEVKNQDEPSSKLTILSWSHYNIDIAMNEFNISHPDIELEQEFYDDEETGKVKEKIITEIMSGEGPDIQIMRVRHFPNLHKMLDNKIFYNLDTLIKNDKSFEMQEYNQIVFDSGMNDGKRFLVPLYFNIPAMITTKSFLANNGFTIQEGAITWTQLSQMAKEFVNNEKNKGKYMFSSDYSFEELIQNSYMKYIDFNKRKASFDSPEFIALLKMYKEVQPAVCPVEIEKKAPIVDLMKNSTYGVIQYPIDIEGQANINSVLKQYLEEEAYIIPLPAEQQKSDITATVGLVAGIKANCKKPQEAYEFMKLLLAKDNQIPHLFKKDYNRNLPVNIEACKEELNYWMSPERNDTSSEYRSFGGIGGMVNFASTPLSADMGAKADKLYNGITKAEINDYTVLSILKEDAKNFLDGTASAEKTAKAINDKVMLYLNE